MSNLPAHLQDAIGAMQAVSQAITAAAGDFNYLKLAKNGEWLYGAEDDEPHPDSVFIVDTNSFFLGFQAWDDGELAGEETRLITEKPLTRADLPNVGAQWNTLIGFKLLCVEGPDEGLQLVYKTTAKGGIKAVNNLMKEIVKRVNEKDNEGKLIAEIQLGTDSYKHKKYGKIFTPDFIVVGWTDQTPTFTQAPAKADPVDDDQDDDNEPEPVAEKQDNRARRRRNV